VKRAPIALLAALVAGMALVAAGIIGDRFGFHDWPMSPAPQMAQHVTVSHPTLTTGEPEKRSHKSSPATVAAESAEQTLPADSARGATRLTSERTTTRTHRSHSHADQPVANDDTPTGGDAAPMQTSTTTAPPTTTPAPSSSEVAAAGTSTPATTTARPAEPDPTTPSEPTTPAQPANPEPAPAPPTTGGGKHGEGTGNRRRRGPVKQLLHDLLGLGNVQD
jgi:hypothetical protein